MNEQTSQFIPWNDIEPARKLLTVVLGRLVTQMAAMASCIFLYAGGMWMNEGYGLNPFIAIPVAMACLILPHLRRI